MSISGYMIEKYNNMCGAYACRRLIEEGEKIGVFIKIIGIYDTYYTKDGLMNNGELLHKRDFIINRYKYGKLKNEINKLADKTYNSIESFNIYMNKFEQVRRLESKNIVMPNYIMGLSSIPYENIKRNLRVPFVAKGLESSMGNEVMLIKNESDYHRLHMDFDKNKEWLYEEFIENSFGKDIRLYCIRGKIVAAMKRSSNGDFRANYSLGGCVENYEVNSQMKIVAKEIFEKTRLDFLGIDLLFGEENYIFCEINVMAGIKGIEAATGVNIAYNIVKVIKEDFVNE